MKKQPVRVIRRSHLSAQVAPPSSLFGKGGARRHDGGTVRRAQKALSIEREWRNKGSGPDGDHYEGYFHAAGRKFRGKATVSRTTIDIYIQHPPQELRYHPHWECFFRRKDDWYWIHHTGQGGLDSAILEIEAILNECRPRHHSSLPRPHRKRRRPRRSNGDSDNIVVKILKELFG